MIAKIGKKLSRKGLYEFIYKSAAEVPPGARVLTISSGGEVTTCLRKFSQTQRFELTTTDINPANKPDILADVCTHSFGESHYDFVFMIDVLEHVCFPQAAIDNLHRSIKSGGKLFVSAPFIFPIHNNHDLWRFTDQGFNFLLRGWKNVEIGSSISWAESANLIGPRLLKGSRGIQRVLAGLLLIWALIKLPFVLLLSKLLPSNIAPARYHVTATK